MVAYMNGQPQAEEGSVVSLSTEGCVLFGGTDDRMLPFPIKVAKVVLLPKALDLAEIDARASEPIFDDENDLALVYHV